MVKDIVQSPANKNSQRIIKLATEILELLNEHIDSEYPHCRRFLFLKPKPLFFIAISSFDKAFPNPDNIPAAGPGLSRYLFEMKLTRLSLSFFLLAFGT